ICSHSRARSFSATAGYRSQTTATRFLFLPLRGTVLISHIIIVLTGMPGGGGILSAAIEHSANPAEPIEALGLTRRLVELYSNRLYLELAFPGNSAEKLVNRGLVALAQRMELPLVATGGVRFARPQDALAHTFLETTGRGTRAEGGLGHNGRDGYDVPTITVEP